MKKYTIIYMVYVGFGEYVTRMCHVTCENLAEFIDKHSKYSNVCYVFDGHIEESSDQEIANG